MRSAKFMSCNHLERQVATQDKEKLRQREGRGSKKRKEKREEKEKTIENHVE